MKLLDDIKDRWITWRTGKNREQLMTIEQWTMVRITNSFSNVPAYQWCIHNITITDWYLNFEGFLFKHEKDAIMFSLRWL